MKEIKLKLGSVLLAVALVLTGWAASLIANPPDTKLGGGAANEWYSMASSSAITVTTDSTNVAATSSSRQYLAIVNDSTSVVYLSFNDVAATANSGLRLNANGGSLEITDANLYKGAVKAIVGSGTAVLTVTEK